MNGYQAGLNFRDPRSRVAKQRGGGKRVRSCLTEFRLASIAASSPETDAMRQVKRKISIERCVIFETSTIHKCKHRHI